MVYKLKKYWFDKIMLVLCFAIIQGQAGAQISLHPGVTNLLFRLDSASVSRSITKHFAAIYLTTSFGAVHFFDGYNPKEKALIERFELSFASLFFTSAAAFQKGEEVTGVWKNYYADTSRPALAYILYGINAHINGDIWQALTNEFSYEELKYFKKSYQQFYKGLKKDFDQYYADAYQKNAKIRLLHTCSLGLDKWYGKLLLNRWRKRQFKLAWLYFTNKARFEMNLGKLRRKMLKTDQLIRKNI